MSQKTRRGVPTLSGRPQPEFTGSREDAKNRLRATLAAGMRRAADARDSAHAVGRTSCERCLAGLTRPCRPAVLCVFASSRELRVVSAARDAEGGRR